MGILLKSVLKPSAQTNKLLKVRSITDGQMNAVVSKLEVNRQLLGDYYHLFMIMFLNGTRISETLSLKHRNINSSGQVYMIAAKGSESRLLHGGVSSDFLSICRLRQVDPFSRMNRFQAYRMLQGLGIGKLKKGRVHESVTHIFRDMYAKRLRQIGLEGVELSKVTGHKNYKNVEHYGRD